MAYDVIGIPPKRKPAGVCMILELLLRSTTQLIENRCLKAGGVGDLYNARVSAGVAATEGRTARVAMTAEVKERILRTLTIATWSESIQGTGVGRGGEKEAGCPAPGRK